MMPASIIGSHNYTVTQIYCHTVIKSHSSQSSPGQSTMSPSRCTIMMPASIIWSHNYTVTQLYCHTVILSHRYTVTQLYCHTVILSQLYCQTVILSHSYTVTYLYFNTVVHSHSSHLPSQSTMSPLQCAIMMFIWSHTKPYNYESKHRWRPFFLFSFWQSTSRTNHCDFFVSKCPCIESLQSILPVNT